MTRELLSRDHLGPLSESMLEVRKLLNILRDLHEIRFRTTYTVDSVDYLACCYIVIRIDSALFAHKSLLCYNYPINFLKNLHSARSILAHCNSHTNPKILRKFVSEILNTLPVAIDFELNRNRKQYLKGGLYE